MTSDGSDSSGLLSGGTLPAEAEGRAMSRLIAWLTGWWLASPVLFWALAVLAENDGDTYHDSFLDLVGAALGWMGIGGVVLAPIAGLVAASIARRRRACVRFALMGAVSVAAVLLVLYALLHAD